MNEAVSAFDRALAIDKDQYLAYHEKGVALARLGRYEEAVAALSDAIALDGKKPETHYEKGRQNSTRAR